MSRMTDTPGAPLRPHLAQEAKAIVALAVRNGPIEDLHAGAQCPSCSEQSAYSHITDDEMKAIIKTAVDRVYQLLRLKAEDGVEYGRQIAFGNTYTRAWDEPKEP